jgi:hypothetical protein
MASIKYPTNFDEQVKLFKLIYEQHVKDGEHSILKDYPFENLNAKTDIAVSSDKKAKELAKLSQEQTQQRNLKFEEVEGNIRAVGNFLKAKFRDNPKEAGKWGFTVVGD